jgi:hypothetical protein
VTLEQGTAVDHPVPGVEPAGLTADEVTCLSADPGFEDEYYICTACTAYFDCYRLADPGVYERGPSQVGDLAARLSSPDVRPRRARRGRSA